MFSFNYFRFNYKISPFLAPYTLGLMGISRTSSVYCTICVTLERYYVTTKPFSSNDWIRKKLLPLAVIFATTFNIPKFFELKTHKSIFRDQTFLVASALRKNPLYISIYMTWMKIILIEVFPYLLILTLNVYILKEVYSGSKFRKKFNANTNSLRSENFTFHRMDLPTLTPKKSSKLVCYSRLSSIIQISRAK